MLTDLPGSCPPVARYSLVRPPAEPFSRPARTMVRPSCAMVVKDDPSWGRPKGLSLTAASTTAGRPSPRPASRADWLTQFLPQPATRPSRAASSSTRQSTTCTRAVPTSGRARGSSPGRAAWPDVRHDPTVRCRRLCERTARETGTSSVKQKLAGVRMLFDNHRPAPPASPRARPLQRVPSACSPHRPARVRPHRPDFPFDAACRRSSFPTNGPNRWTCSRISKT
jgi:hypothetical protein